MADSFYKKSAGILASIFIGIIILSFMFTGFQTGMGPSNPGSVAEVDGTPIKFEEYQKGLSQKLEMYRQMNGGQSLTSQQIEELKVKENVLEELISQKLIMNLSKTMGVYPSNKEVAMKIQAQPYFQNEGSFSIDRYRAILEQNHLAPIDYEKMIEDELTLEQMVAISSFFPLSDNYLKEREQINKSGLMLSAFRLNKSALTQMINISEAQIETFIKDSKNQQKLESYFASRKAQLDQKESVEIRHILIRVTEERDAKQAKAEMEKIVSGLTPANFSNIAKEKSEDPTSKEKGGLLPRITKGTFLPEIEEVAFNTPVGSLSKPFASKFGHHIILVEKKTPEKIAHLDDYKRQLAKEILQKEDTAGLAKVEQEARSQIIAALKAGNKDEISKLATTYKSQAEVAVTLGQLDNSIGSIHLQPNDLDALFVQTKDLAPSAGKKEFVFEQASEAVMAIAWINNDKKMESITQSASKEEVLQEYGPKIQESMLKNLRKKAKIKEQKKLLM